MPADQAHRSVWLDTATPRTPPLGSAASCDVCVVGAGIAGLLTAQSLAEQGASVIVIDAASPAGGETARTTAHLVTAMDDRYTNLRTVHGARGAALIAQSHAAAIDHLEALAGRLNIDCAFRRLDGYLFVPDRHAHKREKLLQDERSAARDAGLEVDRVETMPPPWPQVGPALRFPRQAQFHPRAFLAGILDHLSRRGVRVHGNTKAAAVAQRKDGVTINLHHPDGPAVRCRHAVIATNTPVTTVVSIHTKQMGYQTYVVALRVPAGAFPEPALLWDGLWEDDASYRYTRLMHADPARDDLLIVGGEDHKTGQGPQGAEPFRCLEEWARRHFPMCGAVERRWSGEVMEPADGVAYIGRAPLPHGSNTFLVTGDSGNGMTHGAIASLLIPELIAGRASPIESLYDPARKVGRHAWKEYADENLNTLAQYRDWLSRGSVPSEDQIPEGSGAVVTRGLRHLAVYKDPAGRCTRVTAVCPHLGGIVHWNPQEQTWDCPCHASRFDRHGRVIHGPANKDLSQEPPDA